jgi:hypothetical protein
MLTKIHYAPMTSNSTLAWLAIPSPVRTRRYRPILLGITLLALGACTAPMKQTDKSTGFIKELPEGVALIAAPYQNLQEVVLKPEDGCYWYRHYGQVETTMLPLRTVEGRPICTQVASKPPVAG